MSTLTISAAARRCGVHRRTLQRAIRQGRLSLTPDAQLTLEALAQAGYTAETPQDTPHRTAGDTASHTAEVPQVTPQVLGRMLEVLTNIASSLSLLCERLAPQDTPQGHAAPDAQGNAAETPHVVSRRAPQRHTAEAPHAAPQDPPAFDQARHRLGRLCPRGHDWQGTGQSLRVKNKAGYCLACNAADVRARRQARRP